MPITLIGDTDQLLYRFSFAKPEIIARDVVRLIPDILTFKLETNYRSTQEIIDRQRAVIAHNYGQQGGPYDDAIFKFSKPRDGALAGDAITVTDYETVEEEAEGVADQIEMMLESGREPGDFFVGARTVAQLGYLEGPLVRRQIPFLNLCGGTFFGSKHIQDVVSYIKIALNESDATAFKRVYNIASTDFVYPFGPNKNKYCHHRFLGAKFLTDTPTFRDLKLRGVSSLYWQHQKGAADIIRFVSTLKMFIEDDPFKIIDVILEHCYLDYMRADEGIEIEDEGESSKVQDFDTLKDISRDFATVSEFVDYVDMMIEMAEKAKDGNQDDYVIISTVHRLKGKERPIVFGVGVCEGYVLTKSGEERPAGLLPHTFSLTPPPQFGIYPAGNQNPIEDERCIFFVLISRAKEQVHLSYPARYREAFMFKSRFIREMGGV